MSPCFFVASHPARSAAFMIIMFLSYESHYFIIRFMFKRSVIV